MNERQIDARQVAQRDAWLTVEVGTVIGRTLKQLVADSRFHDVHDLADTLIFEWVHEQERSREVLEQVAREVAVELGQCSDGFDDHRVRSVQSHVAGLLDPEWRPPSDDVYSRDPEYWEYTWWPLACEPGTLNVVDALDQREWWVDRFGRPHLLTAMSLIYLCNVVTFLEARASVLRAAARWFGVIHDPGMEARCDDPIVLPGLVVESADKSLGDQEWLAGTPLLVSLYEQRTRLEDPAD